MQETDSIANAETAHVYTIVSLYFGTHWIRKLVHWTDNSHVRKRCILTTMLCIPCVTTQHLHTISIVYIKCTGQLCWSIASAVPVCIMSEDMELNSVHGRIKTKKRSLEDESGHHHTSCKCCCTVYQCHCHQRVAFLLVWHIAFRMFSEQFLRYYTLKVTKKSYNNNIARMSTMLRYCP